MIKVKHILEYVPEKDTSYAEYTLKVTMNNTIVLFEKYEVQYDYDGTADRATPAEHIPTLRNMVQHKHRCIQRYLDDNNLNFLKDNT